MTVSTDINKFRYEGNGVTDTFAFTGRIFTSTDVVIEIITRTTDVLVETLTITTDYTVTINSEESASIQVTNVSKIPSATQDIQIRRALEQTQTVNLPTGTVFPALSVENAIDKNIAIVQDLSEEVGRSIKLSPTTTLSDIILPDVVASEVIGWNSAGDNLTTYSFSDISSTLDTVFTGLTSGDYLKYDGNVWTNIDSTQLKNDLSIKKSNTSASNPTVNDDDTQGYEPFSEWLNTSTTEKWVCLDNSTGAAVWEQGTLDSSDLGSAAIADLIDDDTFATATSSNIPSAESVKTYVDNSSTGIFSNEYESAETAYVNGSSYTFTHGLGAIPKIYTVEAVCKTTEAGIAVGERFPIMQFNNSAGNPSSGFVSATTTQIKIKVSGNGVGVDGSGGFALLTPANFRLIAKGWV